MASNQRGYGFGTANSFSEQLQFSLKKHGNAHNEHFEKGFCSPLEADDHRQFVGSPRFFNRTEQGRGGMGRPRIGWEVAFDGRDSTQAVHQTRRIHAGRTTGCTCMTRCAQPNRRGAQHLVFAPQLYQTNDTTRGKCHLICDRTSGGALVALQTHLGVRLVGRRGKLICRHAVHLRR